jgi:hypothetical protein
MLVPLFGFLAGDTLGLIVLVRSEQLVGEIATVLQDAAGPRVPPRAGLAVYWRGHRLDSALTIADAGIEALDRVDVREDQP